MGVLRVFLAEDLLCIQRSFSESSMDLFMLPHHQELCYSSAVFCFCLFSTKIPLISPSVLSF